MNAREREVAADPYEVFYQRLRILREDFHRIGRFDDANAKLDELCKLFVLKTLDRRFPSKCNRQRLSLDYLRELAQDLSGDSSRTAGALHAVFKELSSKDGESFSAFGNQFALTIDPDDDEFARALVPVVEALPVIPSDEASSWSFDLLNETFGHFVQDSIRHRKEDAQYLTPPEVVAAIVDIGLSDMLEDYSAGGPRRELLIADPTCGVGSFLAAAYCHARRLRLDSRPLADQLTLFGQDKVDRMVRLAKVNLQLFTDARATVQQGNSVSPATLDAVTGKVDLLLTNPPFGAAFSRDELLAAPDEQRFPILTRLASRQPLPRSLDSEFVMLDRNLSLLRDGGRMLIVVPDKVVAADGFAAAFRKAALELADLVAIIDLPADTFAQAGTRTKTSVVYLRRRASETDRDRSRSVFMATADDIGFRVSSRAGANVKRQAGTNQLLEIVDIYRHTDRRQTRNSHCESLGTSPSVSLVAEDAMLNGRWNAGFYRVERMRALSAMQNLQSDQVIIKPLSSAVAIDPDHHQRVNGSDGSAIISVLHVRPDGFVDLQAASTYAPTSPCVRCQTDDVLLSRINPRIVRICVVPEFGRPVACSPEFAVLRCQEETVDPWELALILRSHLVQSQLQTLTSGTSSSHNRIKPRDLALIELPLPQPGSSPHDMLTTAAAQYRDTLWQYYTAVRQTIDCFHSTRDLMLP